jgi:perosamine synthetase
MNIPLFKIYWDEEDIKAVESKIRSGKYWCIGQEIEDFENKINDYIGTKYCKVFNSGGSALHALMKAYGLREGDEIIVPSFTFIATAYAPLYVNAKPIFADVEEETFGLDPEDVERKITSKTRAVIPIHYGGFPCNIKALKEICEENDILLIEDAAESFGAKYNGKSIGGFGDSSIFSFCQNKIFTTSEGGCVVTNTKEIDKKLEFIRSYGREDKGNYFENPDSTDYLEPGYNFRMSSLLAKLGISQLKKVDKMIDMRRKNAFYLNDNLKDIDQIIIPEAPDNKSFPVYQMYTIIVKEGEETRNKLMQHLKEKGISSRIYFDPVHKYSVFKELGYYDISLPTTEKLSRKVLSLPMYPGMEREELDYIAKNVKEFFKK